MRNVKLSRHEKDFMAVGNSKKKILVDFIKPKKKHFKNVILPMPSEAASPFIRIKIRIRRGPIDLNRIFSLN